MRTTTVKCDRCEQGIPNEDRASKRSKRILHVSWEGGGRYGLIDFDLCVSCHRELTEWWDKANVEGV